MSRLRISIVTPSFNQAEFIDRTVRSVLDQRGDFELDYRVVDGGSTDGTLAILRRYGDRLEWTSERDEGQVDAINKGLRSASGDIVGWLNSDDVLAPGALERVAQAFAVRPSTQWVHGRCDIIDTDDRVIRRWISYYKDWCARHYSYPRLLTENFIDQMTVFFRRGLLSEIGYLDQHLKLAFDYDLWLRLAQRADPIYIPDRQACFRWYATTKSGSSFEEQFREDYRIALQHAPERRWLLLLKRAKSMRTVSIYRGLRFIRSVVQEKG